MYNYLERTSLLIGKENTESLQTKHIAVFGLGGVGSYTVECLVRCGVGKITIIDNDHYTLSNINRQLYATSSTIGRKKVEVSKERILDINSECQVHCYDLFVNKSTINDIDFSTFDYVIDAIDFVEGKEEIIKKCHKLNIPIISCMGTGNKLSPQMFSIDYIENTSVCPLAKSMRKRLKDLGISKVKVLYSKEQPTLTYNTEKKEIGSICFVTSVAGMLIAGTCIKDSINL